MHFMTYLYHCYVVSILHFVFSFFIFSQYYLVHWATFSTYTLEKSATIMASLMYQCDQNVSLKTFYWTDTHLMSQASPVLGSRC